VPSGAFGNDVVGSIRFETIQTIDYIQFNPVKHGLALTAAEWPYSSFKDCVKLGTYPPDWIGSAAESSDIGGLR
jgi:hypothetical protein